MNAEQIRAILKDTFNTVADAYDHPVLRFFPACARQLVDRLELRGDERVLDVATGTGHAALELAARLPRGRVTGVDFSAGMLAQARQKAAARGIANVASKIRPGGRVALSSFQLDYFRPLRQLLLDRLAARGIVLPPQPWERIATEAGCRALCASAGLRDVRIEARNAGYFLADENEWWSVVWNAGFRRLVGQLPPADLERFRKEHLRDVAALKTAEGLWLDIGVFFAVGTV